MSKRILAIILLLAVILPGCRAEEVSNVPIDTQVIEAYDEQKVEYDYIYDWVHGEYRYLPTGTKLVHHEAEYRVKYRKTYSDGYVNEYWETVTEKEYREAVKVLKGGGE